MHQLGNAPKGHETIAQDGTGPDEITPMHKKVHSSFLCQSVKEIVRRSASHRDDCLNLPMYISISF